MKSAVTLTGTFQEGKRTLFPLVLNTDKDVKNNKHSILAFQQGFNERQRFCYTNLLLNCCAMEKGILQMSH